MDGIAGAVAGQRAFADGLFDRLRADSLDAPGVTRDPYGAGEQRAHATARRASLIFAERARLGRGRIIVQHFGEVRPIAQRT